MEAVKDIQVYLEEAANKEESIQFPVVPSEFKVDDAVNNVVVNIASMGDANLPGKKSLRELILASFFPAQGYGFLVCEAKDDPYEYIEWLRDRKNNGVIMRIIITGTDINFTCLIEKLEYGEDDASGDVNFSISLKEYIVIDPAEGEDPEDDGGGRVDKPKPKTYTVKKGDTLKKIAKKYLGSASKSKKLYKKNKKVIEKAFKKWKKQQQKKGKKIKAKNSQKGKYLIKGTKLTL